MGMRKTNVFIFILFIALSLVFNKANALAPGEYISDCLPHGEGLKNSFRSEVRINDKRFEGTFLLFEGPQCKKQVLSVDYTAEMSFEEQTQRGALDKRVIKAYLLVLDEKWRHDLNLSQACGPNEILLNVPIEIQGSVDCGPFPVPKSGTVLYDFFERRNSSFSLGAYPLLWITEESKRPALTSRIEYKLKEVTHLRAKVPIKD